MHEHQPTHEHRSENRPRIYVASLTDYNNSILHGDWLAADADPETLQSGINQMLATSPTARRSGQPAEEWAIHDHQGFATASLGEWEPVGRVTALASGIVAHGDAFAAWWSNEERQDEDWADLHAQFEQAYLGEYSSTADYAADLCEGCGFDPDSLAGVPEFAQPYVRVDIEALGRDLVAGGDIFTTESKGGVYVFTSL